METGRFAIRRIVRFSLVSANADRLARFYERALGCRRLRTRYFSGAEFERSIGLPGGAYATTLSLGNQIIELLEFDRPGRPYPRDCSAADLTFQHFAIVVANIDAVLRALRKVSGWRPISIDGPQILPQRSGGVTAFKFRDPEGHPLELLAFAANHVPSQWQRSAERDLILGIDHSAISVADSARSTAFYERLGLTVAAHSLNHGAEQQRLDAIADAHVEVTALAPADATPHIELLCYRSIERGERVVLGSHDIAATRIVIEVTDATNDTTGTARAATEFEQRGMLDPDGHRLAILAAGH